MKKSHYLKTIDILKTQAINLSRNRFIYERIDLVKYYRRINVIQKVIEIFTKESNYLENKRIIYKTIE